MKFPAIICAWLFANAAGKLQIINYKNKIISLVKFKEMRIYTGLAIEVNASPAANRTDVGGRATAALEDYYPKAVEILQPDTFQNIEDDGTVDTQGETFARTRKYALSNPDGDVIIIIIHERPN